MSFFVSFERKGLPGSADQSTTTDDRPPESRDGTIGNIRPTHGSTRTPCKGGPIH